MLTENQYVILNRVRNYGTTTVPALNIQTMTPDGLYKAVRSLIKKGYLAKVNVPKKLVPEQGPKPRFAIKHTADGTKAVKEFEKKAA